MFGSRPNNVTPQVYTGIQVPTSMQGTPIPLLYGLMRTSMNLLWYGDFVAHPQGQSGKGGGNGSPTSYAYSAAFAAALCEGPIQGVAQIFHDRSIVTLADEDLTLYPGAGAIFFGYISGTTLTVTNLIGGTIAIGNTLSQQNGVAAGTKITAGSGSTWTVTPSQTVGSIGTPVFLATAPQPMWTVPPSGQQLAYDHIAYVVSALYNFGTTAAMPNLSFEVKGLLYGTGPPGPTYGGTFTGNVSTASKTITNVSVPAALKVGAQLTDSVGALAGGTLVVSMTSNSVTVNNFPASSRSGDVISFTVIGASAGDADPSLIFTDYLTDPNHGASYPGTIATLTGVSNTYQAYCWANGIGLSPVESTARNANEFLKELLQITNSDVVDSAGTLNVIPYADQTVTGNGYTYTPGYISPGVLFEFGDDDYLVEHAASPLVIKRKPLAETYNHVVVEYKDRQNYYNIETVEAFDLNDINQNGNRTAPTLTFHSVTDPTTARNVAQLQLQISLFERNVYKFKVRYDYCVLEPMDFISVDDATLGLTGQVLQIISVTETKDYQIEIEAREITGQTRTAPVYNWGANQGYFDNYNASGGSVATPLFFIMPPLLTATGDSLQLGIAVCPPTPVVGVSNWGGCQVWMSVDAGSTYTYMGNASNPGRYGTLTGTFAATGGDPDTTDTCPIAFTNTLTTLNSGTSSDADNMQTLILIDPNTSSAEIIAFSHATNTGAGAYTLDTYIRRGQYGTAEVSHASTTPFVRIDSGVFLIDLEPGMVGQTLYFKFLSYNQFGQALETLSAATAYSYAISPSNPFLAALTLATQGQWFAFGAATIGAESITRNTGVVSPPAYDSGAVTQQGLKTGHIRGKPNSVTSGYALIGLATGAHAQAMMVATSNNLNDVDYAFVNVVGVWYISELGTTVTTVANAALTDEAIITYDGSSVKYWINGKQVGPTRSLSGATLFGAVAVASIGQGFNNLSFGSGTNIMQIDTTQIGQNAATSLFTVEDDTTQGPFQQNTGPFLNATYAYAAAAPYMSSPVLTFTPPWDGTAIITATTHTYLQGIATATSIARSAVFAQVLDTTAGAAVGLFPNVVGHGLYNVNFNVAYITPNTSPVSPITVQGEVSVLAGHVYKVYMLIEPQFATGTDYYNEWCNGTVIQAELIKR